MKKFEYDVKICSSFSLEEWHEVITVCQGHDEVEKHTRQGGVLHELSRQYESGGIPYLSDGDLDLIQKALEMRQFQHESIWEKLDELQTDLSEEKNRLAS